MAPQKATSTQTAEPATLSKAAAPARQTAHSRVGSMTRLQQGAGNQAVQRLVQARLSMSQPGDSQEQEAEQLAERVVSGEGQSPPTNGHTPSSPPGAGANARASLLRDISPGTYLDPATRLFMEARLGIDLSQVRVHTDRDMADSARVVNADAYTVGSDVVFGNVGYDPTSMSGRRLLAHELAHVAQQANGRALRLQRQQVSSQSPPNYTPAAPPPERNYTPASLPGDTPQVEGPPTFDPQAANVVGYTNEMLSAEITRVRNWLSTHTAMEVDYSPYTILGRRLGEERTRRIGMGYVWLRDDLSTLPTSLISMSRQGRSIAVIQVDPATGFGAPLDVRRSPVMSNRQFQAFLAASGIRTMTPEEYAAQAALSRRQRNQGPDWTGASMGGSMGSFGYLSGPSSYMPGAFAGDLNNPAGWRGNLGELAFQRSSMRGLMMQDLNLLRWTNFNAPTFNPASPTTTTGSFPTYDFQFRLGGYLVQVKTSVSATPGARYGVFLDGFADALGTGQQPQFRSAVSNLIPEAGNTTGTPSPAARSQAAGRAIIAVNADDVTGLQEALRDPARYSTVRYQRVLTGLLGAEPAQINGVAYNSYTALEAARQSNTITQQQYDGTLRTYGERAAQRVVSNGLTLDQLTNLQNFRTQVAARQAANPALTEEAVGRMAYPELLESVQNRGNPRAQMSSWGGTVGRGGAMGGGFAVVTEAGVILLNPDEHPEALRDLAVSGGSGFTGGVAGAATERYAAGRVSQYLITQELTQTWMTTGGRSLAGGIGGGVAAPVMTTVGMLLDDQEHTGTDYAARNTRAFVSGGLSAALSAGVVGAIWGSEVPIAGNIVGFVVGFGGYLLVDWLVGEDVEQGVRSALDDNPRPSPSTSSSTP
ncbi:MAG: hypothetical protein QOH93_1994, partial [Chloroflexia bacterium]|nr:hypothetical protein [Chloroflexia bacterium]